MLPHGLGGRATPNPGPPYRREGRRESSVPPIIHSRSTPRQVSRLANQQLLNLSLNHPQHLFYIDPINGLTPPQIRLCNNTYVSLSAYQFGF